MHPTGMLSSFNIMSMGTLPSRMGTEQFLFSCLATLSSIIFEGANADVDAKCEWVLKACMHYTIQYSSFRMVNASKVEINNFISVWLLLQTNTLTPVVKNADAT